MSENDTAPGTAVPAPLRRSAERAPEAPALLTPAGEALSYGTLDAAVGRAATRLADAGVGPGDRQACLLPRTPTYVALLLALWRRRAVAAPLPARTPPAARARLLRAIDTDALILGGDVQHETTGAAPPRVLHADELVGDLEAPGATPGATPGAPPAEEVWPTGRPLTLVFTSGSTGTPKAALHTAGNHFFSAEGSRANLPLEPGDRWLLSLPLYHVGGLSVLLRCLWAGATVAFPQEDERAAEAIPRTEATHVSLVAAQLRRLLAGARGDGARGDGARGDGARGDGARGGNAKSGPPDALKIVLMGGGPVPPPLLEAAHEAGWPLATSYGLTEMTSQVATTAPGAPLGALLRTAGRPLPHRRVRIRAASGREAGEDDVGEILVKGKARFAGYVEDGGRLHRPFTRAFDEGGWLATGDLGRFDAAGRLRVTGRRDRQFTSGGENVQPEEIEAALRRLPAVADAAVVPVPHPTFGRRPVAFIRGPRGTSFSPSDEATARLREALRRVLPAYAVPDAFHPWPGGEAENEMKPDRAVLQQKAEQLSAKGGAAP